jgi:hypothetical protein
MARGGEKVPGVGTGSAQRVQQIKFAVMMLYFKYILKVIDTNIELGLA